jgi:DNA repair protein RadC
VRQHDPAPVHWTGKLKDRLYFHISDQIAFVPLGQRLRSFEDRQLLTVLGQLISPKYAERVVATVGASGLRTLPVDSIRAACNIPRPIARRIKCARELANLFAMRNDNIASSNAVIAELPAGLATLETEVILGFALNAAMIILGVFLLAKGGGSYAALSSRDVFVPMLRASASAFVIVHNHPSGDPMPSPEDRRFTESLADAAHVLGIAFVDHLIVAKSGITSMLELGLLPKYEQPTPTTVHS